MTQFWKLESNWMSVNYLANLRKLNSKPAVGKAEKQPNICNGVPKDPRFRGPSTSGRVWSKSDGKTSGLFESHF